MQFFWHEFTSSETGKESARSLSNVFEQSNTLEMAIKLIEEKNIAGKPRYSRDSATPHAKLRE